MDSFKAVYFLRLNEVISMTGVSRSTIYAYVKIGQFPKPVKVGLRCVAWLHSDVQEWCMQRTEQAMSLGGAAC